MAKSTHTLVDTHVYVSLCKVRIYLALSSMKNEWCSYSPCVQLQSSPSEPPSLESGSNQPRQSREAPRDQLSQLSNLVRQPPFTSPANRHHHHHLPLPVGIL